MIGLATRGLFSIANSSMISLITAGYFNPIEVAAAEVVEKVIYTTISKPTIDRIIYRDRVKPIPRIIVSYKDKKEEEIAIGVQLNETRRI